MHAVPRQEVCPLDRPLAIVNSEGQGSDPSASLPSSGNYQEAHTALNKAGSAEQSSEGLGAEIGPQDGEDEWEAYWKDEDTRYRQRYIQSNGP